MIIISKKNYLKKFKTKQTAITLISLIITIVILLILAGVVLNLTLGEKGIFNISKNASKNFMDSQDKELSDLEKLYSEMKIATNDDSQITVNVEDLKKIIQAEIANQSQVAPTGINKNSLLFKSINNDLGINRINLTSFTNDFSDSFTKYFDYNTTTGLLTCKEDGWFLINLQLTVWSNLSQNSVSHGVCHINDIQLFDYQIIANSEKNNDTVNTSIYLRKGDTIFFEKYGQNASFNIDNHLIIKIFKI